MNEADLILARIEAADALAWWRCPHGDAALEAHICWVTSPTSEPATLWGIERQIAPRQLAGREGEEQTRAHLQLLRLAADLRDRGVLTVVAWLALARLERP
jgi:hypothetical protein